MHIVGYAGVRLISASLPDCKDERDTRSIWGADLGFQPLYHGGTDEGIVI